jgi:ABC-type sugar transport system ATPase subunit
VITGIAGPNGAGKSTMVRILAGETARDDGDILLGGAPWDVDTANHAVAVVHQEPQLFPNLTVGDNIMVGREGVVARHPSLGEPDRTLLAQFGILDLVDRPLGLLPLALQQRVEIVRGLAFDARVVLFDEPNSALTEDESRELFSTMRSLAMGGRAVILVSHRLAELVAHADSVSVILDGRRADVLRGERLTEEALARAITVRSRGEPESRAAFDPSTDVALALEDWRSTRGAFDPVSIEARRGEIVAVLGVEGSGGREFVRSLAGFEPADGGLRVSPTPRKHHPAGYVAPDRRATLFFNFSVAENLVSRLDRPIRTPVGARSRRATHAIAKRWFARMSVKASGLDAWIGSLSGGNQQKVVIAAAMAPEPPVLVLEEPTRGVDIGSKREIYAHLRGYAASGRVVVLYCTEVPEAFDVADTIYVMGSRRLAGPLAVRDHPDEKSLAAAVVRLESNLALPA